MNKEKVDWETKNSPQSHGIGVPNVTQLSFQERLMLRTLKKL